MYYKKMLFINFLFQLRDIHYHVSITDGLLRHSHLQIVKSHNERYVPLNALESTLLANQYKNITKTLVSLENTYINTAIQFLIQNIRHVKHVLFYPDKLSSEMDTFKDKIIYLLKIISVSDDIPEDDVELHYLIDQFVAKSTPLKYWIDTDEIADINDIIKSNKLNIN